MINIYPLLVHVPSGIGNTSPNRAHPAVVLEVTPQKGKRRLPLSNPSSLAKRVSGRPKCTSPAADSIDSALELPPSTALRIEAHPGVCACSGNCGLSSCNRAKALSYSRKAGTANPSFCLRDAASTSNYCICCRCEAGDCQRQKTSEADGAADMHHCLEKPNCNRASSLMHLECGLKIQRGRGSSKWWPTMGGCLP